MPTTTSSGAAWQSPPGGSGATAPTPPGAGSLRAATPPRGEELQLLREVTLEVLDGLPALTERVLAAIREAEPRYAQAVPEREARAGVREALRAGLLAVADPPGRGEPPAGPWTQVGRDRARNGLPLDALLRAYRIGGMMLWEAMAEAARRRGPQALDVLVRTSPDGWERNDQACVAISAAYDEALRLLTVRFDERARAALDRLLAGPFPEADIPVAAAALGLPSAGRYAVVVVRLTGALRGERWPDLFRLPGGMRAVLMPSGRDAFAVVHLGGASLRELAEAIVAPAGGLVGISTEVNGLREVHRARRLAEAAVRVGCAESGRVVRLDERLPTALVAAEPEVSENLLTSVLGPVLELDPAERDALLDTFAAWMASAGSTDAAAAAVSCHRNTVLNRLQRLQTLIGRDRSDPRDLVEVALAVDAYRQRRGPDVSAPRMTNHR